MHDQQVPSYHRPAREESTRENLRSDELEKLALSGAIVSFYFSCSGIPSLRSCLRCVGAGCVSDQKAAKVFI